MFDLFFLTFPFHQAAIPLVMVIFAFEGEGSVNNKNDRPGDDGTLRSV